ncbi:hypothetical protein A2282_04610 [candidate division WOR-1 bacterium RIFOXYA12_FULL_36_13]|nr:MAG: hypothetical protein A2282_04610 [candidate division WOR-1 bacterium RIFOXYA12_FULL_36_13]
MEIFLILGITAFLAIISFFIKNYKTLSLVNVLGHLAVLSIVAKLTADIYGNGASISMFNFFYADPLSIFFMLIIGIINTASIIYSVSYISNDLKENVISSAKANLYYVLFNALALATFLVVVVDNLGMLWIAIELTTLISALLVGFYNKKNSIEAAWKYIIICSVGITIALFGTILFYYAATLTGATSINWTNFIAIATKLDPQILKVAFLFIFVGYGTKAGIVPLHTWLPDAHSQAPTPISMLLSGVLLKTAIYAIIRFAIITNKSVGIQYSSNLFLLFGLLSLGIAAGFILVQKDIKRLLAYSSIEHIGIILIGLGFSGIGIYGALLHTVNHAITKSFMFLGAGNIVKKYKTGNMNIIRGVINLLPFTGTLFILGAFALGGTPPFSIFLSEFTILMAGFQNKSYLTCGLFLFFIAIIFGAIIHHFSKIIFGKEPADSKFRGDEPRLLTVKPEINPEHPNRGEDFFSAGSVSLMFLFIFLIAFGIIVPGFASKILLLTAEVIKQ